MVTELQNKLAPIEAPVEECAFSHAPILPTLETESTFLGHCPG